MIGLPTTKRTRHQKEKETLSTTFSKGRNRTSGHGGDDLSPDAPPTSAIRPAELIKIMRQTCAVCSQTFSHTGDLKCHMTSVHDETHYPCQCGKVFSCKDIRFHHQRTCPKRSDSQSLQLGSYMSCEPTPKTSTTPSLLKDNSQSGMAMSETYGPPFDVQGSMQIIGPNLSRKITWLFELIKDEVTYLWDETGDYVFVKPCTLLLLWLRVVCKSWQLVKFVGFSATFHQHQRTSSTEGIEGYGIVKLIFNSLGFEEITGTK